MKKRSNKPTLSHVVTELKQIRSVLSELSVFLEQHMQRDENRRQVDKNLTLQAMTCCKRM